MKTEYWFWAGNEYALYSENPEVRRIAREFGLRLAGEYFNVWRPEAGVLAWQYIGPREAVLAAAARLGGKAGCEREPAGVPERDGTEEETVGREIPTVPKVLRPGVKGKRECVGCGRLFTPRSNWQRYCSEGCREAGREEARERGRPQGF